MVVVGENRPGFELLAVIARDREQASMQYPEAVCAAEVMYLEIGAGGNEERAARGELVSGSMRPRCLRLGHGGTVSADTSGSQLPKSGRGLPQSKTLRDQSGRWEVRQVLECASPLALWPRAWDETTGETLFSASSRSRGKAVEGYRSPRRFATLEAAGKSARFWSARPP